MQLTNNSTTVDLNEQKILDLIIDSRIEKLERVLKAHYRVTKISDFSAEAQNILFYLCVVALDKKAAELAEIYDVSIHKIVEGAKVIHKKGAYNKVFYTKLYDLYITFRQNLTTAEKHKNVA